MNCQHDDPLGSNGGGAKSNSFMNSYESLNISKNSSAEEIAEKYLRSKLSLDFKNIGKASYNASGGAHRNFYRGRNVGENSNHGRTENDQGGHLNVAGGQTSYRSRANEYPRPERKANPNPTYDSHFNNVPIFSETRNTNSGAAGNLHYNTYSHQNDQSRGYTNSVSLSNNMTNFFSSTNSASPTDFTHLSKFKEEKNNSYYVEEQFLKFGQSASKAGPDGDSNKGTHMNSIDELLKKYGSSGTDGDINMGVNIGPHVGAHVGVNFDMDIDVERSAGSNTQAQRRLGGDVNPIFHRPARRKNSEGMKIRASFMNKAEDTSGVGLGRESNKSYYPNRMNRFVPDISQGSSKKKNLMQRNKDYVHYLSNRNSFLKNEVSIKKDLRKKKGLPGKLENTYLRRKTNMDGIKRHGSLFSSVLRGYQSRCNNDNDLHNNINIFNNSHVEASQNNNTYRRMVEEENSNLRNRHNENGSCFSVSKSGHSDHIGNSAINMSFFKSTYSESSKLVDLPVNGCTSNSNSRGVNIQLNTLTNDSSDLISLGTTNPGGELLTTSSHISALHPSKDKSIHYNDLSSNAEIYGALYVDGGTSSMVRHTTVRGEHNDEHIPRSISQGDGYHEKANTSVYEKKLPPTGDYFVRSDERVPIRNSNQSNIRSGSGVASIQGRGSSQGEFLGFVSANLVRSEGEKNFLHPLYFSEKKLLNIFNNKLENNNMLSSNVSIYSGGKREGSVQNCSEKISTQNKIAHGAMLKSGISYREALPCVVSKEKKKHMKQVGSIHTYEDYLKYITESINGIPISIKNIDVLLALALYSLTSEMNGNTDTSEIPEQVLIKLLNKILYCLNLKTCLLKDTLGGKPGDSNKYYYIQIRKNEEGGDNVGQEKEEEKGENIKGENIKGENTKGENTKGENTRGENTKGNYLEKGIKTVGTGENTKRNPCDHPNQVSLFTLYNKRIVLEKKDQVETTDENPKGILQNQRNFCQDSNYKKKCFYLGENMKIITLVEILKIAWCLCVLKKNVQYVDLLRILYKEVECMKLSNEFVFCISYLFKYCNIIHLEDCKSQLTRHVHLGVEDSTNENLCMYLHLLHMCSAYDKRFITPTHRKNIDRVVSYFYDRVENISLYACTNILCALSNLNVKNEHYPYFFHKILNYFRSNVKKITKCVLLVHILWSLCMIEFCCTDFFKDLSEYIISILHFLPLGEFITISCCFSCQKMLIIKNYFNNVRKTVDGTSEHRFGITASNEREYSAYEPVIAEYYTHRKLFPYCFYHRPVSHALVFKILAHGFLHYEERDSVKCPTGEFTMDHTDRSDVRRKTCRSLSVENRMSESPSGAHDSSVQNSRFNSSNIYRAGGTGGVKTIAHPSGETRNEVPKNRYPKKMNEKKKIKEYYKMYDHNNKYEFALNSCERILFENLLEDCCNNFEHLMSNNLVELLFTLCTLNLDRSKIVKIVVRKIDCAVFEQNYDQAVKKKKYIHKDLTEDEKQNERNDLIILNYIYNKYVQENSYTMGKNDIDEGFLQMVDNVYFCRYIKDDLFLRVIKTSKGIVERTTTGAFSKLRNILNAATVSRDTGDSTGYVGKNKSEKEYILTEVENLSDSHHHGIDTSGELMGGTQERNFGGNISKEMRDNPTVTKNGVTDRHQQGENMQMDEKLVERPDEVEACNSGGEYIREEVDLVGDTPKHLSKFKENLKNTYDTAISYCNKRTNHLGKGTSPNNSGGISDRTLENGNPQEKEHLLNNEIYEHIVSKRNIKNIIKRHKKGMVEKIFSFSSSCGDNTAFQVSTCDRAKEKHNNFHFYRTFILLIQLSALSLLSFVVLFVYTSLR
ncbi:conserved Plasmodium protein, unknown function [Plasmodium knowlesi strain H]|uniref:Uncharacterized protein n=3 Tax=Plasmodium knowlesi TaxID=5850 RepID=A0A5K1VAR2_PLAKH|nr:conserved Plasmodium protein, unknown function [Plasmodium knowlesi strain H]OTN65713.1 Uncharacterized protein PKNOH_S110072600 [Plasmodium knowlesi]CAA9989347.1 conserved Plasmodium protein, unknown function [Plasmodium knowlesi strain H]SBO24915.1 conserved Plasmodium protein, unknown function [Plasmodium knowlesi strain H]SBO27925.1 conserved Plasmodium protein, unknown function [Plasmodium knowlesi strain H]VVS78821.1 conserved Plasmodium protein, unknown function [Plasmodium knowlesi |eukprot:XP_002260074.1 hypothetical protein, conserved in Plasmodium species [Plasmodium knowlesi strain H]